MSPLHAAPVDPAVDPAVAVADAPALVAEPHVAAADPPAGPALADAPAGRPVANPPAGPVANPLIVTAPTPNVSAHANIDPYFSTRPCKSWNLQDFLFTEVGDDFNDRARIWTDTLHTIRDCHRACCPPATVTRARNLLLELSKIKVCVQ